MANYDHFALRKRTPLADYLAQKLFQLIQNNLPQKGSKILEIGTGDGVLAQKLIDQNYSYIGYEPSPALFEKLQKQNIQTHNLFVPPIIEENRSFDAILLIHVIEHMSDMNTALELLNECKRTLKDHGKIILITPDIMDFKDLFWDCDSTHCTPFSFRRLEQLSLDCDLNIHNAYYIYGSLKFFPGYLFNVFFKTILTVLSPFENLLPRHTNKLRKAKTLFARSLFFVFTKNDSK